MKHRIPYEQAVEEIRVMVVDATAKILPERTIRQYKRGFFNEQKLVEMCGNQLDKETIRLAGLLRDVRKIHPLLVDCKIMLRS